MGRTMHLAISIRRLGAGSIPAILLFALSPLAAEAQYRMPRRDVPLGYPAAKVPPERESLLGNGGVGWPSLPFSRKQASDESRPQQPTNARSVPRSVLQSQQPPHANHGGMPVAQHHMPQHGANLAPNGLPRPTMNEPQQVANRGQFVTPPSIAPRAAAPTTIPATNRLPEVPTTSVAITTASSPALSQAAQTLAKAHGLATTAKTEDDYTIIINACQQARAGQQDPTVAQYATELCSWALNRRGQLKAEAGNDTAATADFDGAVAADSKRWRAIHNRGVLLAQNGDFEKAFDDFSRTIQLNPKFAKAYSNRGALFVVAGNLKNAKSDYEQALKLDPQIAVAYRGLGRAFHLDGELDMAMKHYDEAVRLAPNDAYAIASRADVLTDQGRYDEASAAYEKAIEIDPSASHAYSGSAWLLSTCPDDAVRNPQLALERSQKAVSLSGGEDSAAYDTLAAAQANRGNFEAAKQAVKEAVRLATPGERQAYEERLALYEQGKPFRLEPIEEVVQASHQE